MSVNQSAHRHSTPDKWGFCISVCAGLIIHLLHAWLHVSPQNMLRASCRELRECTVVGVPAWPRSVGLCITDVD